MSILRYTLPLPPSINHYYVTAYNGKRIKTQAAKDWMDAAKWTIKLIARDQGWRMVEQGKVIMRLWVYWPNKRRQDVSNLHKALCDAPEGIAYVDDRCVLVRDIDFDVDAKDPRVVVEIEKYGEVRNG